MALFLKSCDLRLIHQYFSLLLQNNTYRFLPASASMGFLCRWRSIQTGRKRWWQSRCQWGRTGRWSSCRRWGRCTGPASASPRLPLPAGWLPLSKRMKEIWHKELNESREGEALFSTLISTVVFLRHAKGRDEEMGIKVEQKGEQL